MDLVQELIDRGILFQHSAPVDELEAFLAAESRTVYAGFDPTADSLHVGNLIPIFGLRHFQRAGHRPIILMGGGTGLIGDPSGKDDERALLDRETVQSHVDGQRRQMKRLLDFDSGPNAALLVNNIDWLSPLSFLEFLRDVGKHFRIGEMIARESVKRRLEGEGLSFTEFSYQLLQGYDFLHLHDTEGCRMQLGGSDQWGNICGGIDLIRKKRGVEVYGLTFPLITTAGGEKFGKSAGNAVWLDPEKTSPYQFYQYWIRTDDRDVERYLKYFVFLPLEEIADLCSRHNAAPEKREAQRVLAEEMTRTIHGPEQLAKAQKASQVLFGGEISGLTDRDLEEIFADVPSTTIDRARLEAGVPLGDLLAETGLSPSKGAARKLVQSGGAYLNNERADGDARTPVTLERLASDHILILRAGKKSHHLLRVE